ncbi:MAG: type II toxin-antitoxin system RelE/ParE family toxin [Candidatus Daviesbacteria bacterium]|nr:type II toxin-antitoxin system RelE/ParE family toxin [Candidatus Daviesbacteria bacterium]
MVRYTIITYSKAREFIESLTKEEKARVDRAYYLFEEYGTFLPSKYLKKLKSVVWELRPGNVRLFLTLKGHEAYVVHGIHKKSQKTPKMDLELAIKRIKEI